MKIAVTCTAPDLDAQVDPRFGRCACFLIVDTETMAFEAVDNANVAVGGGAGIQSAQAMSEKDVKAVLTGNCGPNAFNALQAGGIQVVTGVTGTARNAVEQFKADAFSESSEPSVPSHHGTGSAGPAAR